ncbi:MAG: AraC family transcriptional regulator [Bacillota bacterium]
MYYRRWVQRALDHIEANLTNPVDAAAVAQAAGFSLYHFHRIFQGATGESVADYLRRRRLAEAAKMLLHTRTRIIDVALLYQFESQASFTRAFRRVFGVTPGQYRQSGQPLVLLEHPRLTGGDLEHLADRLSLQPEITRLPAMRVVGLPYRGTNRRGEIPALWPVFQQGAAQIAHRREPHITLGICEPAPLLTESSEIDWLWATEVEADPPSLPEGWVARTLPPSQYAVFTHRAGFEQLGETYRYIVSAWLPRSGFLPANSPDFEHYDAREPGVISIHIPIEAPDH